MFENLGWSEILMLLLVGLFIFGPERLPKVISDGMRMVRTLRQMATNATSELREELGTDLDVEDLNPRTFVRKHLLSEQDQEELLRPLRQTRHGVEELTGDLTGRVPDRRPGERPGSGKDLPADAASPTPFDADAT